MFLCVENHILIALLANNFTILNRHINGHIKECFQCAKMLLYDSLFKYNVYSKMTSNATFNDTCAWPWITITFQPAELLLSPLSLK